MCLPVIPPLVLLTASCQPRWRTVRFFPSARKASTAHLNAVEPIVVEDQHPILSEQGKGQDSILQCAQAALWSPSM